MIPQPSAAAWAHTFDMPPLAQAHCAAYRTLKQLPGGQEARIGLVHQHIVFMPRDNLPWVR